MSTHQSYDDSHREDERLVEDPQALAAKRRNVIISRIVYAVVALCVFGVVAAIVTVLILTYTNPVTKKKFEFDDIFNGKYFPKSYSLQWSPGSVATTLPGKPEAQAEIFTFWNYTSAVTPTNQTYTMCDVIQYNTLSNQPSVLISYGQLQKAGIGCDASYIPSPDNRFLAFMINQEKVFRHSILGTFVIYDTVSHTAQNASRSVTKLQKTFSWCTPSKSSPTNFPYAFVEDNNVFVSAVTSSGQLADVAQVTTDGDNELIVNGVTDWLYEEEVYGGVSTMKWSTDCSRLAFLKINDTQVPAYKWEDYSPESPYPLSKTVRITTPGYPNPTVSAHVYSVDTHAVSNIDLYVGLKPNSDIYVYDLVWASPTMLATVRVPRLQNQKDVLLSDTTALNANGMVASTVIKTDTTSTWIQYAASTLLFLEPTKFVDITVDPKNANRNYHLALYDTTKGTEPTFLTSGDYDVVGILSFNTNSKEVFITTTEHDSTNRVIKAVKYDGTATSRFLSSSTNKGYYAASFSPSGAYYQLSMLGPQLPIYKLEQANPQPGTNVSITLLDNTPLQDTLNNAVNMPSTTIKEIKNREDTKMKALFVYPPGFSENSDVKYPAIIRVYGGPGSQLVLNSYSAMHDPLSLYWAAKGYIVVTVDGRGTGARGEKYMTGTYKNLGDLESQDQITAAKYLKTLNYIDGKKVGIWGWSYGGYMTLMSLTSPENEDVFRLGMAVAPVTDWDYYDSAYTERYMQWPAINPEGYKNSSVIERVIRKDPKCPLLPTKFEANGEPVQSYSQLLLVHGTGDDNVHPLNTYNLITTLQDRQVQFSTMFYPNKDHSITGGNTRRQLYALLSNTLFTKLA